MTEMKGRGIIPGMANDSFNFRARLYWAAHKSFRRTFGLGPLATAYYQHVFRLVDPLRPSNRWNSLPSIRTKDVVLAALHGAMLGYQLFRERGETSLVEQRIRELEKLLGIANPIQEAKGCHEVRRLAQAAERLLEAANGSASADTSSSKRRGKSAPPPPPRKRRNCRKM